MLSWVPVAMSFDQASLSWATLLFLIWFSGLKRCASYVRLNMSQSPSFGFSSMAFVTGEIFRSWESATVAIATAIKTMRNSTFRTIIILLLF